MGKTLGIIALIFGIIGIIVAVIAVFISFMVIGLSPFISFPIPLLLILGIIPIASLITAIICGAIGIKKDDSPGLAIAGLAIGTLGLVPQIFYFLIFSGFPTFMPF